MKILLIAPFEKPESTAWLILKAMKNLGLNIEYYSYREESKNAGSIEMMNTELAEKLKRYIWGDLIFVIKGETIFPETLEASNAKKALWHFDFDNFQIAPQYLEFWKNFHYVFLMCYPWVEQARELGINAFFMPQATDPSVFHPTKEDPRYTCDVAFIGSWKPGREEMIRKIAMDYFVRVFGNEWINYSNSRRNFETHPPVYFEEFNKVCSSAKIVLNITPSLLWPIYPRTFSQRVYMVMAAGGHLATDNVPEMPLKWLAVYDNIEDLRKIIRDAKTDNHLDEIIRRKARWEILKKHTYYHRVKEILTCLKLSPYALKNIPV